MTNAMTRRGHHALLQVGVAVGVGLIAALVTAFAGPGSLAPLTGWDAAALTYLAWTWAAVGRLDGSATKTHARREDPTRPGADLVLLLASAASLVAVGLVLVHAADLSGARKAWETALSLASVVISWFVVHTTYTLRYAKLFHDNPTGGVDFNSDAAPTYSDFAYVSFTIGMTFQVSDTNLTTTAMRGTALRHALLSYLYGTVIIATSINILAGLTK